jgi:hypothetical protein
VDIGSGEDKTTPTVARKSAIKRVPLAEKLAEKLGKSLNLSQI